MPASEHVAPISRREDALAIVRRLVEAGHVAYFAGGCVRDALLGLIPMDYDVATDASPDVVRRLFRRSQGVGQSFGVVLVREGQSQVEVATFRVDGSYTDGRRPDGVRFASAEEDARRRDFTINGLFYDPLADRVIDLVEGVRDLHARTLRAIGDPAERFAEDYLRMLRATRFASRFNLTIDPPTAAAIRASADRLPRIAPERIADELRAMLTAQFRREAVRRLDELELTPVLLRHFDRPSSPLSKHTLFDATCACERVSFALALACWTAEYVFDSSVESVATVDAARCLTRTLRQTFRLSNDDEAHVEHVLRVGPLLERTPPTVATLKRFMAARHIDDALRFLRGLAAAGVETDRVAALETRMNAFTPESVAPAPFVGGDDLIAAGVPAGPKFKAALDAAYDAQLEDVATDRAAALAIALQIVKGA